MTTQGNLFGPLASSNARIDREVAELRRDLGVARGQGSAGSAWIERAVGYVMEYAAARGGSFLCEDVRSFATDRGFESPPNPKSWGGVMRIACTRGIVHPAGYAPANSSNRSPKVLWRAR